MQLHGPQLVDRITAQHSTVRTAVDLSNTPQYECEESEHACCCCARVCCRVAWCWLHIVGRPWVSAVTSELPTPPADCGHSLPEHGCLRSFFHFGYILLFSLSLLSWCTFVLCCFSLSRDLTLEFESSARAATQRTTRATVADPLVLERSPYLVPLVMRCVT